MSSEQERTRLPLSPHDLRQAVLLYIEQAYGPAPPARISKFLPPEGDFDVTAWLMSDVCERTPSGALDAVRSFALRIGCSHYRHMKLRVARPGRQRSLVFTVDSHDAFLMVDPGSPDFEKLEELKKMNAATATRINAAWESAGLLTEKNHLREAVRRAKKENPAGNG